MKKSEKTKLKAKTSVKGGGGFPALTSNHNEQMLKKTPKPKMKVQTQVKGGGGFPALTGNHNESAL